MGAQKRGGGNGGARKVEDPRGAFRWDKLAPGDYVLSASAPDKPPARSDPVTVTAGAVARARIVLSPGGTVVGHVYDERRAPIADVNMSFDTVSSVVGSSASAKTDASGQYRLDGAPSGTPFTLRAQKDGFRIRLVSGLHVDPRATVTRDLVLTSYDGGPGLELGGIGANVTGSPEGIAFGAIYPGDPADRAGLKAGDRVIRVDGEDTDHMSVADTIQRLRGEVGTTVGVSVARANGETMDVFITRAAIVH
jgi:membrane-associated protease RseP (regulator of RpoE activity)